MTTSVGIIGHAGFVGSAFREVFSADKRYSVVGIGRENYSSYKGRYFDMLINCNGNSSKLLAEKDPRKDFEMNVFSTISILEDFGFGKYIHVSSIEVYLDKSSPQSTGEERRIEPSRLSKYGLSKFISEMVVKSQAKEWMVLRLGGMVGNNMRKGPAYDILALRKLFISDRSRMQFMNTRQVAIIAKALVEKGKWNQIYNVIGKNNIELSDFARLAGVQLGSVGSQVQVFGVSSEKLQQEVPVPTTRQTIREFISQWKSNVL